MTVFLRGIITPDYLPLVRDFFVAGEAGDILVPAILDTGFSGMVVLPHAIRSAGRFEFSGVTRYELANGEVISAELFKAAIRIGRRRLAVDVSFTDSELGLVGMALIDGKRASFNLKTYTFRVYE